MKPTTISYSDMETMLRALNSSSSDDFLYPRLRSMDLSLFERVLIISPHPDDDVIACGGTIRKLVQQGTSVKVVYMTDGRGGNMGYDPGRLVAGREVEAKKALTVLGCSDAVFLRHPDMGLSCDREVIDEILTLLRDFKPDAIFVPSILEFPPDHRVTADITMAALAKYKHEVVCLEYEVWTPLPMTNVLVDITDVVEEKARAILEHRSQMEINDYSEKIIGLNAYRSMIAESGVKYCEGFHRLERKDYVKRPPSSELMRSMVSMFITEAPPH